MLSGLFSVRCPPDFGRKFKQLHKEMKGQLNFNGPLSEPIAINTRDNQGNTPAPTYSLYSLLWHFQDCEVGVYLCFKTTVFDLTHFKAKSKSFQSVIQEFVVWQYRSCCSYQKGDAKSNGPFFKSMHHLRANHQHKKDQGYVHILGQWYVKSNIFLRLRDSMLLILLFTLKVLMLEVFLWILKSTKELKMPAKPWVNWKKGSSQTDISLDTKISVYWSRVLTTLLCSSGTWNICHNDIKTM